MAIDIKFDLVGNLEPPTIILANRNGNKLGQLKVNTESIDLKNKLVDASEFSFTINKYIDYKLTPLWEKVVDFKLVYCKEWDAWFEIKVELDEETETVKTVFCTQLGQAELSQIVLYDIEINTEKDIERDDYKISILCDADNQDASILHRIIRDKAPHYSIAYVSPTIAKIQRSFSFDGTSILDAFQEIAEEIGCLFQYYAGFDEDGVFQRKIAVYDLQQYCNDCEHRGEFTDKCPKCGSTNITNGYGEDTLIFVTSDELASEGIQLVTDTDSVKNCFKLEAGDDLMTATIRNCNPNGTDYIWYFSDAVKEDMSDELVEKIESYDETYRQHYNEYVSDLDTELLSKYNALANKYSPYNESIQPITTPITGYSSLMNAYYNTVDLALYLQSGLMPSVEMSETNAIEQAGLLTSSALSPVAVADVKIASLATANSAVLAMAKIIVKSTYKVEIKTSELYDSDDTKYWKGKFVVTNYSDEEDIAESNEVSIELNDDLETVTKQKIDKILNKENTDDLSITGLFEKEYDDFCIELKKYALNPLTSFYDACQACIDILIEQGVGNAESGDSWSDDAEGSDGNLYEKLYAPYYDKLKAIEAEMKVREDEINVISGVYDTDGNLVTKGLQTNIEECRSQIQNALNFEEYIGEELWLEFCSYRREDKFSNDNYISDGLNSAELFEKAREFFEIAENEIYKSAELQHSISTTLNNLLAIPKFKNLVKSFEVGNWIRVQIDDRIFKLRLLEYEIDFGDFNDIPVEFSDVAKIKNGITDVESILSQASSMATSYDSVQRQAKQGNDAQGTINQWLLNGLNSAHIQIQNNDSEEITLSKNGLLGRSYDEITGTYAPEQFRLTHNIMAYTTDDWKTVSSALGKHEYTKWENNKWIKDVGYGLSSTFVTAGYVTGSQIIGGEIVSSNYKSGESGTYFDLINGDFEIAGGNIVYDTKDKALTLKNVTIEWSNTNAPEVEVKDITGLEEYLEQLDNLEDQLDGRAQTWYQSTDPSTEWTTDDLKNLHIGDLWHYTGETGYVNGVERTKNSEWIWQNVDGKYQWVAIEVSDDIFDAIDGKSTIYVSQPSSQNRGDLLIPISTFTFTYNSVTYTFTAKKIYRCTEDSNTFRPDLWVEVDYTDDTLAKEALEAAKQGIADAAEGINLAKAAQESAENAESNAKDYADTQDGLLSDRLTDAYEKYTKSEISTFDSYVAKYLGLGGGTIIGENYVISPIIEGGYLNITNVNNNSRVIIDPNNLTGNNYIFQVHNGNLVTVGIDKDGNAEFNGKITATSLTLESGAKVNGLSYNDLTDKPVIPDIGEDLELKLDGVVYKSDITQETITDDNGITFIRTTVPAENGTYTYDTYDAGDYIVFGGIKGTNTENATYFCVSKEGLLTARNALIYGTVYATDGKFIGEIEATSLKLGSGVKISTDNVDGLSDIATSGDYNDLKNKPIIPDSAGNLGIDVDKIIYKGDITQSVKTDSNGISYLETVVPTVDGEIKYSTYDADNYIVFGRSKGTDEDEQDYFCVSKDGLLTARNAVIYGTVYATDGVFTGTISGSEIIGGSLLIGDKDGIYAEITTGGLLTCNGGTIGGINISEDGLYYSNPNDENDGFGLWKNDRQTHNLGSVVFHAGSDKAHIGTAPFRVYQNGDMYANSGKIGNWTIEGHRICAGDGVDVKTAVMQAPTSSAQWVFAAGGDDPTSYANNPFRVHKNGTLYATNAHITGEVTATSGTIGGCSITNGVLQIASANIGSLAVNKISAGTNSNAVKFTNITATGGEVGGWGINTNYLSGTSGSYTITIRPSSCSAYNSSDAHDYTSSWYNIVQAGQSWANSSSDLNVKNSISDIDSYDAMFDNLKPCRYKYNYGTSDRYHTGFIAQEVVSAIDSAGLTTQDFAGVIRLTTPDENGCEWMLRRDEFVALNTWQIQKLKRRVAELEAKLESLQ